MQEKSEVQVLIGRGVSVAKFKISKSVRLETKCNFSESRLELNASKHCQLPLVCLFALSCRVSPR